MASLTKDGKNKAAIAIRMAIKTGAYGTHHPYMCNAVRSTRRNCYITSDLAVAYLDLWGHMNVRGNSTLIEYLEDNGLVRGFMTNEKRALIGLTFWRAIQIHLEQHPTAYTITTVRAGMKAVKALEGLTWTH